MAGDRNHLGMTAVVVETPWFRFAVRYRPGKHCDLYELYAKDNETD